MVFRLKVALLPLTVLVTSPSTSNSSCWMPVAILGLTREAEADRAMVPLTVAPLAGPELMLTWGMSAKGCAKRSPNDN